ncbi:hypothetical protein BD413DRAFT_554014 [Trametes elegans]|nr:hypothetical protein BD413DRAFT_554014 [Trametes elegans]
MGIRLAHADMAVLHGHRPPERYLGDAISVLREHPNDVVSPVGIRNVGLVARKKTFASRPTARELAVEFT